VVLQLLGTKLEHVLTNKGLHSKVDITIHMLCTSIGYKGASSLAHDREGRGAELHAARELHQTLSFGRAQVIERAQGGIARHELCGTLLRRVVKLCGEARALSLNLFAAPRQTLDDGISGVFLEGGESLLGASYDTCVCVCVWILTFMASCCRLALRLNSSRSWSTRALHSSSSTLCCSTSLCSATFLPISS